MDAQPEYDSSSLQQPTEENSSEEIQKKQQEKEQEQLHKDPLGIGHLFQNGQFMMPGYQKTTPQFQEEHSTPTDNTLQTPIVSKENLETPGQKNSKEAPKITNASPVAPLQKVAKNQKKESKKTTLQSQEEHPEPTASKENLETPGQKKRKETPEASKTSPASPSQKTPKTQQKASKKAANKKQASASTLPEDQLSQENTPSAKQAGQTVAPKTPTTPKEPSDENPTEGSDKEKTAPPEVKVDTSSSQGYIDGVMQLPPLSFVEGIKKREQMGSVLQKEAQEFQQQNQEKHAVKDASLGLQKKAPEALEQKQKDTGRVPEAGENIDLTVSEPGTKKIPEKHQEQNPGVPTSQNPAAKLAKASRQPSLESAMQHLPKGDPGLNLSPGPVPTDWNDRQKNQEDIQKNKQEGDASVAKDHAKSQEAQKKDFGEKEIHPKVSELEQTLKNEPLKAQNTALKQLSTEQSASLSADDAMKVNQGLQGQLQGRLAEQRSKLDTADEQRQTQYTQAELDHEQKLDQKNTEYTQKQTEAQKNARQEVNKQRQDWKAESDQLLNDYQTDSGKEREKVNQDIQKKTEDTDQQVKQKYQQAEQKAAQEKQRREKEAAQKEAEAKKEADNKGFWGRLTSAVKGFFEGLRKALNFIFDQLRKAVKAIIEGVKKLVNGLIELARKAIVGLIKAFGEVLKKLVSVALAAFPKLAARINALIDQAVNAAVKLVNVLADQLKKAVSLLLDALGKVLDTILAAYQAIYNAVLDALEFVAVGLIEIMQGIANLISAARRSPDFFWGQLSEELLGADITKPLPNEAPMPTNAKEASKIAVEKGDINSQDAQVLEKSKLEAKDAVVDPVLQNPLLSPELQNIISNIPDGKEIEFGEQLGIDKDTNADELKKEAAGMPTTTTQDNPQNTTAPTTNTPETQGQGLVGPFASPMERLGYLTGQMKKAVGEWWSKNKVTVIIGLVAGIAGLILANIATGGAIMAALPLLLQIVGAFFTGIGILDMAKHFGKYLSQAFPGNIAGGAKSLARGLAALTIELIFSLLFGAKGMIKGAKNAVKTVAKKGVKGGLKAGAKAVKNSAVRGVKNTAKSFKELGSVAKEGGQALVKNGKMVFQGIKRGAISGAKTLDDVAQGLAKKFRFKKFKIAIKKRRFKLFGEFNPWVLLADGTIQEIDDADVMRQLGITNPNRNVLGRGVNVTKGGKQLDGVIVGANDQKSILTRYLESRATSKRGRKFNTELYTNVKNTPGANGTTLQNEFVDLFKSKNRSVRNLIKKGTLTDDQLSQIIRNTMINPGSGSGHLLRDLEKMIDKNPPGINHILGNLASANSSNFKGAEWVLRYICDGANPQRLRSLSRLELPTAGGSRIYDAVIGGTLYEFKNLKNFDATSFIEQFSKDITNNLQRLNQGTLKWVYSSRIGNKADLIIQMQQALQNPQLLARLNINLNQRQLLAIINKLDDIIEVGIK